MLGGWTPQVRQVKTDKQRQQTHKLTQLATKLQLSLHFHSLLSPSVRPSLLRQHIPDEELDKLSNRVFQFHPVKDRWTECARMKHSRYRCGAAVLNGEIYILGQTTRRTAAITIDLLGIEQ